MLTKQESVCVGRGTKLLSNYSFFEEEEAGDFEFLSSQPPVL